MKSCVLQIFVLTLLTASGFVLAEKPAGRLFSQSVIAYDQSGRPYPAVPIRPDFFDDVLKYNYALGEGRLLTIATNIPDVESRGVIHVAKTVKRCYEFVEAQTNRTLPAGLLLYLIEMDELPRFYCFEATLPAETGYGDVRLALIAAEEPVFGPAMAKSVGELLFDTLPHELGHEVLADLQRKGSAHAVYPRWFVDGVCELLAKQFAVSENPLLAGDFIAARRPGDVLSSLEVRDQLLSWTQDNSHPVALETDLYCASWLLLLAWTESLGLKDLLDYLEKEELACESDFTRLLESSTGQNISQLINRAQAIGDDLASSQTSAQKTPGVSLH